MGHKCWVLARHILLKEEEEIKKAQARLEAGEDFEKLAEEISVCPSGPKGGSIGPFPPGVANADMEKILFDPKTETGKAYGPVKTKNGWHMVMLEARSGKMTHEQKVRCGLAEDKPEEKNEEPEEEKKDK